jgi:hypothetical protein
MRGDSNGVVTVNKDALGRITVSFPYDHQLVTKVKTSNSREWLFHSRHCEGQVPEAISKKGGISAPTYHFKFGQKAK